MHTYYKGSIMGYIIYHIPERNDWNINRANTIDIAIYLSMLF